MVRIIEVGDNGLLIVTNTLHSIAPGNDEAENFTRHQNPSVAFSCKRIGLGLFKVGDWMRCRTKPGCSRAKRGDIDSKGKAAET